MLWGVTSMRMRTHILFPFDLGLELDFTGHDAEDMFKQVSSRKNAEVRFESHVFSEATVATQIYKFGVGTIEIAFDLDADLPEAAKISCFAENLQVGKMPIVKYCQSHVDGVIQRASKYADYRYEKRLEDADLLPVFLIGEALKKDDSGPIHVSEAFIRRHRKELYGIVAGEPRYEDLSEFVLERG